MEHTIPVFMQYGAMGILAFCFVVVLLLYVRSDKRAATYADCLNSATFDRSTLIQVVAENTKAYTALSQQIARMGEMQERHNSVIEELLGRLKNDRCPLLKEGAGGG